MPALPTAVHRWLRARKQASESHDHRDPVFIRVTPQVVFETYWKDVEAGKGPALIVWFDYRKVLKFDCFGKGRGHYHIALPVYSKQAAVFDRIFLPEETIEAQIERVVFELETNLSYYMARAPHRNARRGTIPQADLQRAIGLVRAQMYEHMVSALNHH